MTLDDKTIDALAAKIEQRLEQKLSDKIVDTFEERVTGKLQKAAGQWLFSLIWKSFLTAALASMAYFYGKNGSA